MRNASFLLLSVGLLIAAPVEAAGISTSRSNIRTKRVALEIDGATTDLVGVDGGAISPPFTVGNDAPFLYPRRPGRPVFGNITFESGWDGGDVLFAWVGEALAHKHSTRSGHVVVFDDHDRVVYRLQFTDALIAEVTLPALEAGGKDAAPLRVTIAPRLVKAETADPATLVGGRYRIDAKVQKKWLPANFRVRIDGLDDPTAKHINKIEAIVIKQKVTEDPVGELRDYEKEPAHLEVPNLALHGDDHWNNDPYAEDSQRMLQGQPVIHTAEVTYLAHDGRPLFTAVLGGFVITQATPDSEGHDGGARVVGSAVEVQLRSLVP